MPTRITLVVVWALVFCIFLTSTIALGLTSPFQNLNDITARLGFKQYARLEGEKKIKIAILDNGFRGYKKEIGKTLPRNTFYHAGPVAVDPETEESHGLFMAQIVSGLLSQTPHIQYELHLYSAFGYSNFEAAVSSVIRSRFDIVLYSQVWEYGGNGNGRGFINTVVSRAINKGIIWINAAGNFANGTFKARIVESRDKWVKLPGPNDSVRVRCAPRRGSDKCGLRAVLTWNDFKDDVREGTDKDLDLILTDDTLRIVASSGFRQMKSIPNPPPPGASLYPRELIRIELEPGLYYLRVKIRSTNFKANRDQLRLMVSGEDVQLLDATSGETLLPPADHPKVITVGALDSERSSSSAKMGKPELKAASLITLRNGENYLGTSNSAAFTAAAAVVLKAINPEFSRDDLLRALGGGKGATNASFGQGLPLEVLGFWPTGPGCFLATSLPFATPQVLSPFFQTGAIVVQTTVGPKVFVSFDPFAEAGIQRMRPDDMLVAGMNGFQRLPRMNQPYLTMNGLVEVVETPRGQRVCPLVPGAPQPPLGSQGGILRLPPPRY